MEATARKERQIPEPVVYQIWNYIGMLGVDRETARDLYQEAITAIWDAIVHRQTHECHSYLVKTGIGAIKHWFRDRHFLIRIPGYLHDRGEASQHRKQILPLENLSQEPGDGEFESALLDKAEKDWRRQKIHRFLRRLTRAERQVIEALLAGQSISEVAQEKRVRIGCVYAQRSMAIAKLRRWIREEKTRPISRPIH